MQSGFALKSQKKPIPTVLLCSGRLGRSLYTFFCPLAHCGRVGGRWRMADGGRAGGRAGGRGGVVWRIHKTYISHPLRRLFLTLSHSHRHDPETSRVFLVWVLPGCYRAVPASGLLATARPRHTIKRVPWKPSAMENRSTSPVWQSSHQVRKSRRGGGWRPPGKGMEYGGHKTYRDCDNP